NAEVVRCNKTQHCRANEKPGRGLRANRVSPSAEVSSLNGGCHIWCVHALRTAVAQSATFKLNSPKMAVPGRNYRSGVIYLIRAHNGRSRIHGIEARQPAGGINPR